MSKLTVLVQAWNVNGGELNNLAITADPHNPSDITEKAIAAYFDAVVDVDEQDDYDAAKAWEEDDCQVVGIIDGHPTMVTGKGVDVGFMCRSLEQVREFLARKLGL